MLSPTTTKGQIKEDKRLEDKPRKDKPLKDNSEESKQLKDNSEENKVVLMSPASHTLTQAITIKTSSPARWDSFNFSLTQ
jgi:hypothetical protein